MFLALLTLGLAAGGASQDPGVQLLDHGALESELARIASEHPDVCTLVPVGTSREGRAISALRLTATSEPGEHPALLLIANLEGPRVFESGVALHHAERLAEEYASSEEVKALLDSTVVWVIPRANPDPAEARFGTPLEERWGGSTGVDNDRDGRQGEDPPADVDGDGLVTRMRVVDPEGTWMEDPSDPRALVEADAAKGERGRYKVYVESRDADADDECGEDPVGDTRVDRNFAAGFEEHAASSGLFPTDEPEARALCEFVLAQRNLVLVVSYGGRSNLADEPESVDDDARPVLRIPPAGLLASDGKLITELGERYREATGNETKGSGDDAGTFARWCYEHRGLFVLEAALWEMPEEAPVADEADESDESPEVADEENTDDAQAAQTADDAPAAEEPGVEEEEEEEEPSLDAKRLRWIDAVDPARFVPWRPFDHPELGAVEIGGFAPFALLEPPADAWAELADTHLDWFRGLGALLPRVGLECTRREIGAGVWEVEAVLTNDSYLPLLSRSMRRTRTTRPARVKLLLPESATLLAGEQQELVREVSGSGGRRELTWLVHGPEGMEIGVSVDTDHAGKAFVEAEVIQ